MLNDGDDTQSNFKWLIRHLVSSENNETEGKFHLGIDAFQHLQHCCCATCITYPQLKQEWRNPVKKAMNMDRLLTHISVLKDLLYTRSLISDDALFRSGNFGTIFITNNLTALL